MPFNWVSLAIWAVSTASYWLTKEEPKEPKDKIIETPMATEGIVMPVFWGVCTLNPINVKFQLNDSSGYDIQNIICFGRIESVVGGFVGGEMFQYYDTGLSEFLYPYPDESCDWYPWFEHGDSGYRKFKVSKVKTGYTSGNIGSGGGGDAVLYYYNYIYLSNSAISDMYSTESYIQRGFAFGTQLDWYDAPIRDNWFKSNLYKGYKPKWRDIVQAFHYKASLSGTPAIQYKVSRFLRGVSGNAFLRPDLAYIVRPVNYVNPDLYMPFWQVNVYRYNLARSQRGVNPAHILLDIMTSDAFSLKIPIEKIDLSSWESVAQTLYDEQFGMNVDLTSSSDSCGDVINQILDYIDGIIHKNQATGMYSFRLMRDDDFDFNAIDTLDESILSQVEDYTNILDGESYPNTVTVNYKDRFSVQNFVFMSKDLFCHYDMDKSFTFKDDEDVARRGVFQESISRPWISDPVLAERLARKYVLKHSARLVRVRLTGDWRLNKYKAGDVIKLNWNRLGFSGVVLRIFNKKLGAIDNGSIELSCIEELSGVSYGDFYEIPNEDVIPQFPSVSFQQAPYWLNIFSGNLELPVDLSTKVAYMLFLLKAYESQITYDTYFKKASASTYLLSEDKSNLPVPDSSLLAFNLTQDITTKSNVVVNNSDILNCASGSIILINNELMRVSHTAGDTSVLQRGCYDTVPEFHSHEDQCFIVVRVESNSPIYSYGYVKNGLTVRFDENINVKILARNGITTSDLATCDPITLPTISGSLRAERPLNCSGLRVDGLLWNYDMDHIEVRDDQDIVLSWKNKNRLNCNSENSNGIVSIYDEQDSLNVLEVDSSYVIDSLNESDAIIRTVVIPYTSQTPSIENTQHVYSIANFMSDFPTGSGKIRIRARRWTDTGYIYAQHDRVVSIKLVAWDLTYPTVWFLYPRIYLTPTAPIRKVRAFKNIFYPEWASSPYILLTSYSFFGAEPPEPNSLDITPSFTEGFIYPALAQPTAGFTEAECIAKNWWTKTKAIVAGIFQEKGEIKQSLMFHPPFCVIRSLGNLNKELYVASNTDYWSDWFDTQYDYQLYVAYSWKVVPIGTLPTKGSTTAPELPVWNSNIELNAIGRYASISITEPPPPLASKILVYARAKAKITRKSDGAIFWSKEYFTNNWDANITPASYNPYRTLKIFPKPIVTITETLLASPPRYAYTVTVTAPVGASWESLEWEWRMAGYYTAGATKPVIDIDPNNSLVRAKNATYVLVVASNSRLTFMVVAVDVILNRTLEIFPAGGTDYAQISPQTYAEWIRP
jgi:hypothetical protein